MTGLWTALATVVSWQGLVAVVLGTSLGIIIGALPGIGPSLGIALLIPFTFNLDPAISLVLMLCLYQGAEYGGSITAVLISTPGGAAAAATVLDGYAMNRRGEGGRALGASLTASSIGGLFSAVVLVILAPLLANVALRFGPPEYFSLGLFGLGIVSSLSSDNPLKGWLVAFLGLAIVTVGVDPISGAVRFTGGRFELLEGVPFMTALIGLFAVTEVFNMIDQGNLPREVGRRLNSSFLSLRDLRHIMPATVRGSVIGTVLGILPGLGPSVAAWLAYDMERRWSKHPETFGTGEIKGVAAPEAANNAVVGGNLVPLLSLGIPSSPTAALLMGALVIHGLRPGPQLFVESPEIVYAIYAGLAPPSSRCTCSASLPCRSGRAWSTCPQHDPGAAHSRPCPDRCIRDPQPHVRRLVDARLRRSGLRAEEVSVSPTALGARDRAGLHDRDQLSTVTPDGRWQPQDVPGTASIPRSSRRRAGVRVPPAAGRLEKASVTATSVETH